MEGADQANIARQEGITRARVTRSWGCCASLQRSGEQILFLPDVGSCPSVTERVLRPIGTIADDYNKIREFQKFLV